MRALLPLVVLLAGALPDAGVADAGGTVTVTCPSGLTGTSGRSCFASADGSSVTCSMQACASLSSGQRVCGVVVKTYIAATYQAQTNAQTDADLVALFTQQQGC